MQPTRRCWAAVGIAVFLVALAALAARPTLLGGAAVLGGWIVARQVAYYRELDTTLSALDVEQTPEPGSVRSGDSNRLRVAAHLAHPSRLSLTVAGKEPTSARSDDGQLALSLPPGASNGEAVARFEWPIAGTHQLPGPSITARDELFTEQLDHEGDAQVVVDARRPRDLHVGRGGDRYPPAYGAHEAGRIGLGLDPAELREYQPGDTMKRVDWKATARLGSPHIRTYDAKTDRTVLFVIDTRPSMGLGPRGETKLDYVREVALSVAGTARESGDPTGVVRVDEAGVETHLQTGGSSEQQMAVRRLLLGSQVDAPVVPGAGEQPTHRPNYRAEPLEGPTEGDPFVETLAPFLAPQERVLHHEERPLANGVKIGIANEFDPVWTLIATDDSKPAEVHEAVEVARAKAGHVLVLLAPTVLFEQDALGDLENAYTRYAAFESFRQDLDSMEAVTALEVAPGDRLSSVLAVGTESSGVAG